MKAASQEEHIVFLDAIRGIAIALVFSFHSLSASFGFDHLEWAGWLRDFHAPAAFLALLPATLGWSGVAVFFVVSGFCIHLSHARSRQKSFKVFFIRRFFRIYPPYLIALAVFAFVVPWTRLKAGWAADAPQFLSHAFLVHNFDDRYYFGVNPAFWSIAVEVQLYVLYPVLLWLARRAGWSGALWMTGVAEIGLRLLSGGLDTMRGAPLPRWVTGDPVYFWFSWALGAALAENYLKKQPIIMRRIPIAVWPPLIFAAYLLRPAFELCFVLIACCTANVMAWFLTHPGAGRSTAWPSRHMRFAGKLSYSIYLIHQPILWAVPIVVGRYLVGSELPPLAAYASCAASWGLVLIPAWLFFRWVEMPSIEAGKKALRALPAPAAG